MKNIPKEIKDVYKTSVILIIFAVVVGFIFNIAELYLAFSVGSIFALINTYLLSREVYTMVYVKKNVKARNPFGFFIRMGIFILGMFIVVYISKKYFPDKVSNNIVFTGLGFMIFKISLFINNKIKIFAKKN